MKLGETTKYLLVGGGVASVSAAKAIRERDKEGRVLLVSADHLMPYDHPPLSKGFLANLEMSHDDVSSKYDVWYTDNKIEVKLSTLVKGVDRRNHFVILENGDHIAYEKLLLATGSRPRGLDVLTNSSAKLFMLRTVDDAIRLRDAMQTAKSAVVVGTGFLGPEVAAECAQKGIETTLLGRAGHIWDRFASEGLGHFLNDYYRSKGVKLYMNEQSGPISGDMMITEHKISLQADLFFIGVGAHLNYELAEDCGISFLPNEGIKVNEYLQSPSDADIYAAGDVAYFPDFVMNRVWHLEHHLNAQWQGEVAGANMAGDKKQYERVPYFFSDFFDLHMILRGGASTTKHTRLIGSFESAEFVELYGNEAGILEMGISISREEKKLDPISDKLEELILAKAKVAEISF